MDVEGFEEWYVACRAHVVAGLWTVGASRTVAEDCADEAFARALARWPRVRSMEHPRRWVHTVAVNHYWRTMRRRNMESRLMRRMPRSEEHESLPVDDGLWTAVRMLPERQRLAVALRYVGDMTEDDVAIVMGITRGTVASTLADARRRLAAELRAEEPPAEPRRG
jgi:RNA polymerase sigma-70 factor (ECF subfamily)